MRRIYFLPNIVTAFSLACGLFVIFKVNMLERGSGDYEVILTSALLLMAAGLADFMDGALARVLHAESDFGELFDTLSDSISFGVAPSVLLLKTLSLEQGTPLSFFGATGCMVYSLCGVLRLVRFNVKHLQAKGDVSLLAAQKKHFTGLPIPGAAAAAVSANLLLLSPHVTQYLEITPHCRAISLTIAMIFLGYLMVCNLKFPSLKVLHFKVPSFHLVFLTVVGAVLFFYGILYFFPVVLAGIAWIYIAIALIFSVIRFFAGKKSQTLADFEPEPDEFEELK